MKAGLEEMKSVAEHQVIPKEEAAVETVRALNKWHGDRHLAVRCPSQPKKWTQCNCRFQKKLATAYKGMTHCARGAQNKRQSKDIVVQRTWKGQKLGKRHRALLGCNNGIRNRVLKE